MPICEISGKSVPKTVKVRIEGVVMDVAPEHAKLGRLMEPISVERRYAPKQHFQKRQFSKPAEPETMLVADFARRIREAREKRGLKQEDLAKMMVIKASIVHQVESGHMRPSDELSKKFESTLNISLLKTVSSHEEETTVEHEKRRAFTLGDMLEQAMKKK